MGRGPSQHAAASFDQLMGNLAGLPKLSGLCTCCFAHALPVVSVCFTCTCVAVLKSCCHVAVRQVRFVVLDEADQMLDMGFQEDMEVILQQVRRSTGVWPAQGPRG